MAGYQKKSSKNARLIALGFAAFILIYLFGQLWGFANLKLRTEQVDEDTIYDFVRAQGTVFRSEQLIEPVSASGVMVYNCADGDEVAMSEEVAAVYSDSTVSTVNNQLEQLQHELDSLTKAQTAKATRYTAVSNLSSEINDQAGKIVDFVQDGVVEGISDQKDELVSLLNRKKIALGQEESFEGRITELNAQISYLEQVKDQQRGVSVESPAAGYFCKEVDGYEEVFTAEALEDITYEGYQQLVSSQPQTVSDAVGKIVTTHGVRGEVKLYPWCDDPEMFLDIETIYLDAKGQKPLALEGVRFAKNMPLLKIEGVNSIDEAAKLRDKIIYIHRDDIPMEEGEYLIQDLMGLQVVDADDGHLYGELTQVSPTGANDVYHIRFADGKERLIPAIPQVVIKVDLDGGVMKICPLEGLFDDED